MKKKNILFCASSLGLGGIEQALINLIKNFDQEKYNITLVLEQKGGIFFDQIPSYVKVVELKVNNNKIVFLRKMINFLRKFNWFISHHNYYDFSCCYTTYSIPSSVIARMSSKNSAIYIHNDYSKIYSVNDFNNFFNKIRVRDFKNVIFVSNESKNNFIKLIPELKMNCQVINNFIDIDRIKKMSKESLKIKKAKNYKYFIFIGRLDEKQKKLSRLLELFNKFSQNRDKYKLLIVGDGPYKDSIKSFIKDNSLEKTIIFLGQQINPYKYLNICDYLILTSDYEGFPVVYLEAICLNKTIITTIDVSDESIKISDGYGYIISKSIQDMYNQIHEIVLNNGLKHKHININDLYKKRINKLEIVINNKN
jgi:glycosyltransferase involved in cell wall biosynthesis